MGKCYCDYCDVFLTNDSVTVRKQHNDGNRHKYNVCEYYRRHAGEQLQEQIDEIVEQFERKVAKGLIKPTYGVPSSNKQEEEEQKQDDDKEQQNQSTSDDKNKQTDEDQTQPLTHPKPEQSTIAAT